MFLFYFYGAKILFLHEIAKYIIEKNVKDYYIHNKF